MGRPKKVADELPKSEIVDGIISTFKAKVALTGREFLREESKFVIPVSPVFDVMLGGGIPEGSVVILSGIEGSGKSITSLHIAKQCQKAENGGRPIFYHNAESRLKTRDLTSIEGLDLDRFFVVKSSPAELNADGEVVKPARVLNATDHLEQIERELRDYPGCCVIIDSVSMLLTEQEEEGGIGDFQRGDAAKLITKFCRRNASLIDVNRCIVIAIVQVYCNQRPQGKAYIEKGGMGLKYQADIHLRTIYSPDWKLKDDDKKPIGKIPHWELCKTALSGSIPGTKFTSYIRYGVGVDEVYELIHLGLELGMIEQKGSFFTCSFMQNHDKEYVEKNYKAQGMTKLQNLLDENPKILKCLQIELKNLI